MLAGDLAMVPWARPWAAASARACGDWRNALGPEPLEELRDVVLRASWAEHGDRDWRAVIIGRTRPLKTGSLDGTLIRVPDTPVNRAAFGSVGTEDDSSPYFADVGGQDVPEMFCLVTDLMDITEYPGPELARLYKWR